MEVGELDLSKKRGKKVSSTHPKRKNKVQIQRKGSGGRETKKGKRLSLSDSIQGKIRTKDIQSIGGNNSDQMKKREEVITATKKKKQADSSQSNKREVATGPVIESAIAKPS